MRRALFFTLLTFFSFGGSVQVASATPTSVQATPCSQWLRLIDVSGWNPGLNWTTIAKAGIAGAYIKTTEITYVNPLAASQEQGAMKAGLPWGPYEFAQPGKVDPVADAKFFVAHSNIAKAQFPPALDLEVTHTSNAATWAWAVAWLKTVDALTGKTAIVYTGAYYGFSQSAAIAKVAPTLWIAAYPLGEGVTPKAANANGCGLGLPHTGVWTNTQIWQFTDALRVPGFKGDASVTTSEWMKSVGLGAVLVAPPTKATPVASPIYTEPSSGPAVVVVQQLLSKEGYYTGPIDGTYSQAVLYGVMLWQHKIGLPASQADGMWGPATQNASDVYVAAHTPKPVVKHKPKPKPKPAPKGSSIPMWVALFVAGGVVAETARRFTKKLTHRGS